MSLGLPYFNSEAAKIMIDQGLMQPQKQLSHRVIRGGIWLFALKISEQILGLGRLVIMARILSPNDFGLFGVALLILGLLETSSETGFQAALIQKKGDIMPYLDSAWTVMIIRGITLFSILYLLAPYAAMFLEVPESKIIIQVIGISFLFQSITNIGIIYFQKELEFNKQYVYQLSGTVADFIVALSAVLILKNVWALVFGILAGSLARAIVSYIIHPYRPRLNFDLRKSLELFGFGKWILGSSILVFLINQGDDLFVGKVLGITALGFYQMAYRISNMPQTEYTSVITQVVFPAYSKLQDNLPQLRGSYLKVLKVSSLLSIPLGGGIMIFAPDITQIFLGEKWMPMVPALQVLAIHGLLRSVVFPGPVFMALGRPDLKTKLQLMGLFILAILIYPFAVQWGLVGVALALVVRVVLAGSTAIFIVLKMLRSSFLEPIKIISLPLINTFIMITVILTLKITILVEINFSSLMLLASVGLISYILITLLFDVLFNYGSTDLIREQFSALRK